MYLTGEYPAISHTFIQREVVELRAQGFKVSTCSIRCTGPEHRRGAEEQDAAATTFYVLEAARRPSILFPALFGVFRRPKALWHAVSLAWSIRPPGLRALFYQLFYLVEAIVLAYHLRHVGATHLHNHFGNSSCSVAMLTSAISNVPFSYTMHGPAIFFEPLKWRIDKKIARAQFVACISHFCRSQGMIFSDPIHWTKLRIVHCAVTLDRYDKETAAPARKRIIFVGRLAAVKGVRVLLEAFALAQRAHPDAELILVGDGVERHDIEAHSKALGCDGAVRFTGYLSQPEVTAELAQADIFALPSFAEGVPVVLMEAMASRLPVIATRVAGIPELVIDGQNGYVVPPGDVGAFSAALITLLDDPKKCEYMGQSGRSHIEAEYNLSKEVAWLASLFDGTAPAGAIRPNDDITTT
ncbi:glycosyltransferase family 4 protein [uncultured Roseobacter sp.]|uniref:glycosyltransferase family 4 protein n=1 Tax=uncultured Roseobacter sp. TaxID=114847 RepID=UPI00345926C8